MLSAVLPPVGNVPVGQHPYIIKLLRGVLSSRPPASRLLPEWEWPMFSKLPFEPLSKTSLKFVTLKTVFLTAITTYSHVSALQDQLWYDLRGLLFYVIDFLNKTDRVTYQARYLFQYLLRTRC